jgi:hypothetical protein
LGAAAAPSSAPARPSAREEMLRARGHPIGPASRPPSPTGWTHPPPHRPQELLGPRFQRRDGTAAALPSDPATFSPDFGRGAELHAQPVGADGDGVLSFDDFLLLLRLAGGGVEEVRFGINLK